MCGRRSTTTTLGPLPSFDIQLPYLAEVSAVTVAGGSVDDALVELAVGDVGAEGGGVVERSGLVAVLLCRLLGDNNNTSLLASRDTNGLVVGETRVLLSRVLASIFPSANLQFPSHNPSKTSTPEFQ